MKDREHASMMLEALPNAVALLRASAGEWELLDANRAFEKLLGRPLEELRTLAPSQWPLGLQEGQTLTALAESVARTGQPQTALWLCLGLRRMLRAQAAAPQPGLCVLTLCDITDEWVDSQRARRLLLASNDYVVELDAELVCVSAAVRDRAKETQQQQLCDQITAFLRQPDSKHLRETIWNARPGVRTTLQMTYPQQEGLRHFSCDIVACTGLDGVMRYGAVANDITEQVERKQRLEQENFRLSLLNCLIANVNTQQNISQIAEIIVEALFARFPDHHIGFASLDDSKRLHVDYARSPKATRDRKPFDFDLSEAPALVERIAGMRSFYSCDLEIDQLLKGVRITDGGSFHLRTMLVMPIRHPSSSAGVLMMGSSEPHSWSGSLISLFEEVAALMELAMARATESRLRLEMEKELAASRERLALLFEHSSDSVWEYDLKTDSIYITQYSGQTNHTKMICAENHFCMTHPEDRAEARAALSNYLSGRTGSYSSEHREMQVDGSYRWVMDRGRAVEWDEDGRPTRLVGTTLDIDERMRMSQEIDEVRARLSLVFENNGDGVWDVNVPQNCIEYSLYDHVSGVTVTETFTLDVWLEQIHPDDREAVTVSLMAHVDGRSPAWDQEYRMMRKDGDYEWLQSRGRVISRDAAGNPLRVVGATMVVEARKQAEEAKRAYERERDRIVAVMDSSSDIIGIVDLGGNTIYTNPACSRLLGYEAGAGISAADVLTAGGRELLWNEARRAAHRYGFWQGENEVVRRDGTIIPVMQSVFPVRSGGELLGYGTIIKDITAQKQLETQLRESRDRLNNIVRCSNTVISHIDRNGIYQYNEGIPLHIHSLLPQQRQGKHYREVFSDNPLFAGYIEQALRCEITSRELSIGDRVYLTTYAPYVEADGSRNGIIAISTDITELKTVQQQLQQSSERLNAVIGGADIILTQYDEQGVCMLAAGNGLGKLGLSPDSLLGKTIYEMFMDRPDMQDVVPHILAGRVNKWETKIYGIDYETVYSPYVRPDGVRQGFIGVAYDVSDRNLKEEEIRFLSYHDTLTGLYNRAYFEEQAQLMDIGSPQMAVIMGDVNGLKLTNDVFGHTEGDRLLCQIAGVLRACCRPQDMIARWGGDEYAVLLPGASAQTVQEICHAIYNACQQHQREAGGAYLSISLGWAVRSEQCEPVSVLLKVAEDAMYKRKLLESKSLHSSIIASISTTLFEKSHETEAHATRLVNITRAMGSALGLSADRLDDLELFSILHDMGKIGISDQALNKPGTLNAQEWEEIRKHPEIGFRIAQASPEIVHIADYILSHHEHWDGSGYPQGLAGRSIPLAARILAIADAYDAMTQDRVYRKAMTHEQAMDEIRRCAGTQFDPELVEIFLSEKVRPALQME